MTHTPDRMEIEKINLYRLACSHAKNDYVLDFCTICNAPTVRIVEPSNFEIGDKLNEVIDRVNELHRRLDEYERQSLAQIRKEEGVL